MQISELASKNCRLKFWKEVLKISSLPASQISDLRMYLKYYQDLLLEISRSSSANNGLIPEEINVKLLDLECKLEQLAELSRLEAGKSVLLTS